MIGTIDYTGKNPVIYTCDRCKAVLNKTERKGIYVTNQKNKPLKKWDLCPRCFKALEKGIEKGIRNEKYNN